MSDEARLPDDAGGRARGDSAGEAIESAAQTLTGIPFWLLREYLVELGGTTAGPARVVGPGWEAGLAQAEDFALGALRVGRVRLTLRGTGAALAVLRPALARKLLRGGG